MNGFFMILLLLGVQFTQLFAYPDAQATTSYWLKTGQDELSSSLKKTLNTNKAKNVILFLGDGMGIAPATASRIYRGQTEGLPSEQTPMSWETFPFAGLAKTYSADYHVTDSAASATAYLCGTKANEDTIGVGPEAKLGKCAQALQHPVNSIAAWALNEGKWAGFVTTTRVTHATPAALYSHSADRSWESDAWKLKYAEGDNNTLCQDIASQLIDNFPGNKFRVIMGGGREMMLPNTTMDPEPDYNNNYKRRNGTRLDGRNLINNWLKGSGSRQYVWNASQLNSLDISKTDYLMGLFGYSHMDYQLLYEHAKPKRTDNPTLDQMTQKAIQVLSKSPNGYFLLVEGGKIDLALHGTDAKEAFEEARWFGKAIATGNSMTSADDTLLVVTADHSHTLTIVGYPKRNVSILGTFNDGMADNEVTSVLTFASGPSAKYRWDHDEKGRRNLTGVDTKNDTFLQPAFMPRVSETHGGEDVGIWARGPFAHIFSGTIENNFIAHAMAFALCVGPSKSKCLSYHNSHPTAGSVSAPVQKNYTPLLIASLVLGIIAVICLLAVGYLLYKNLNRKVQPSSKISKDMEENLATYSHSE